jgi:hypothetical protein
MDRRACLILQSKRREKKILVKYLFGLTHLGHRLSLLRFWWLHSASPSKFRENITFFHTLSNSSFIRQKWRHLKKGLQLHVPAELVT